MSISEIINLIKISNDYRKTRPKSAKEREKRFSMMRSGKGGEDNAVWCMLYNLLSGLAISEEYAFGWLYFWDRAEENKKDMEEFVADIKNGDRRSANLLEALSYNFSTDVSTYIYGYARNIIMGRSTFLPLECWFRANGREYNRDVRDSFLKEKVCQSPAFEGIWNLIIQEHWDAAKKDGVPPEHDFMPERKDLIGYAHFIDYISSWLDKGVIPVNRYGEFVNMKTGQAIPLGKYILSEADSHGLKTADKTVNRYPHIDLDGVTDEKPLSDFVKGYEVANSYNDPDQSSDKNMHRYVKKIPGMGRQDLTPAYLMPEYIDTIG